MKRFVFAAVAGLCSFAPLAAQEGTLAPTVPIVPAPMIQNGNLINPSAGSVGTTRQPFFTVPKWGSLKNTASVAKAEQPAPGPTGPAMPPYSNFTQPLPMPTGVSAAEVQCAPGGCNKHGRARSCWEHFKTWLCYAPSKSDLPKCQPTPYITPLLGMFPCSSNGGYGCATGQCGGQYPAFQQPMMLPPGTQPMMPPPMGQPNPLLMPKPAPNSIPLQPGPSVPLPMPMPNPTGANPVVMPPRGVQGAPTPPGGDVRATPTAPVTVAPAPAATAPATAGYRFTNPYATTWKPAAQPGTVVPASGTQK